MKFLNITIGMLTLQSLNYFLYKNPYKAVEFKRKFRIKRKNTEIYNRMLESEYIEEVAMFKKRYKVKMTVLFIIYGVYVIAKFIAR